MKKMRSQTTSKKEGDISSVFRSLSGGDDEPLPPRFAEVKRSLAQNKDALHASWSRLLTQLREETEIVKAEGSACIPEIQFTGLDNPSAEFASEIRKRGIAVVRQVIPEKEARAYKEDVEAYIAANPSTRAFPPHDPQVYELYWSRPQLAARSHPNMLKAQQFLMSYYHSRDPFATCSTNQPLTYADRLRIRTPGDAGFALGPHVDGGSVERWEKEGYGKGGVYDKIFEGRWEEFDPWELSTRLKATQDLYNGTGACSMFRMFQAWLSMSHTGPREGTLLVNPLLSLSTAYYLLRPFFTPKSAPILSTDEMFQSDYLEPANWVLEDEPISSALHGAWPGHGQELKPDWHPHLNLPHTMVHVPKIAPGDYVAWHCDTIHAVDKIHAGKGDSSVMYIPACPTTELNINYIKQQRQSFLEGVPPSDFPGGQGESHHVGRPGFNDFEAMAGTDGLRAMGFAPFDVEAAGSEGEAKALQYGNEVLGN
ncbi:uncharacterized protein NECHADRAFT_94732 [Fusarium vanettenii 77-13-4]|uniref:DUF1479 domain protein n=1 Tax=Fusarium vanettenii (strain ATCC MYA-4622 / CBS 123669 / FGSC 9596 / NRRL 45880 / 77-13-4) TaxID=660122 RepID=C7ZAM4_FUSV7|nr:uncharacterized protein NECHADRAFT_94732 [Fusarium vanettenii 77-13-4]EEU39299.1 hypothetical protein NECHADRAFT_94732 [Fusarium vanettenii 77-13-4]